MIDPGQMDLTLPNGMAFAHATGGHIRIVGALLIAVADQLKPEEAPSQGMYGVHKDRADWRPMIDDRPS